MHSLWAHKKITIRLRESTVMRGMVPAQIHARLTAGARWRLWPLISFHILFPICMFGNYYGPPRGSAPGRCATLSVLDRRGGLRFVLSHLNRFAKWRIGEGGAPGFVWGTQQRLFSRV